MNTLPLVPDLSASMEGLFRATFRAPSGMEVALLTGEIIPPEAVAPEGDAPAVFGDSYESFFARTDDFPHQIGPALDSWRDSEGLPLGRLVIVDSLHVHPEFRGGGLGGRLLEGVLTLLLGAPGDVAVLHARPSPSLWRGVPPAGLTAEGLARYYERAGFTAVDDGFQPLDGLLMMRPFSPVVRNAP